jgi:hypothetical protein
MKKLGLLAMCLLTLSACMAPKQVQVPVPVFMLPPCGPNTVVKQIKPDSRELGCFAAEAK